MVGALGLYADEAYLFDDAAQQFRSSFMLLQSSEIRSQCLHANVLQSNNLSELTKEHENMKVDNKNLDEKVQELSRKNHGKLKCQNGITITKKMLRFKCNSRVYCTF